MSQTLEQTLTFPEVTRASSSYLIQQLKLIKNRTILDNAISAQQKTYSSFGQTYDSHKADVKYMVADGDVHYPAQPRVLEYVQTPYNTVLTRDTDTHLNTFVKVGTKNTGAAVDATKPRVIVYENRQEFPETITNNAKILGIGKALSPA